MLWKHKAKVTGLRAAKTVETQIKGTFLDAAEAVETQGKGALRKATKAKAVKAQGKCSGNTRQRQWNHKAKAVETQSNGSGNTAQSRCRAMVPPPAALNAASAAVASFTMYSRGNISGYALRPADRVQRSGHTPPLGVVRSGRLLTRVDALHPASVAISIAI